MRHEAEMAIIVQDKVKYHISIKAKYQMIYFMYYSTWQDNASSVIKNFQSTYSHATIKHTNFVNFFKKSGQIRMSS